MAGCGIDRVRDHRRQHTHPDPEKPPHPPGLSSWWDFHSTSTSTSTTTTTTLTVPATAEATKAALDAMRLEATRGEHGERTDVWEVCQAPTRPCRLGFLMLAGSNKSNQAIKRRVWPNNATRIIMKQTDEETSPHYFHSFRSVTRPCLKRQCRFDYLLWIWTVFYSPVPLLGLSNIATYLTIYIWHHARDAAVKCNLIMVCLFEVGLDV